MDLKEAIYGRRAVREYTTEAVDRKTLLGLIDAAIQAPSAVNEQPWLFTIIQDQPLLDRISHRSKTHMLATWSQADMPAHLRHHLSDPDFHIFYYAPALILIAAVAETPWAVIDCSLAAQNLMLAAYAGGLGTCWIGFAQGWLSTPDGKAAIDLAPSCIPVAPIIVGHPKAAPPPVSRKEPQIHWIG